MQAKAIFDVGEIQASIRRLIQHLPCSEFVSIEPIVGEIIEICMGALTNAETTVSILLNYKVPPYKSIALVKECVEAISGRRDIDEFRQKHPDFFTWERTYTLTGPDLILTLDKEDPKPIELVYGEILLRYIENDGYLPEKLKRELGL